MAKYKLTIGECEWGEFSAESPEQALKAAYSEPLTESQLESMKIERTWSGAEWDAAVEDEEGNNIYFFVYFDE